MLLSPGKEEDPCHSWSAIYWHLTRATVTPGQWVPSLQDCWGWAPSAPPALHSLPLVGQEQPGSTC